jgi:phenylalanyl-tRNA synthetase beta chain
MKLSLNWIKKFVDFNLEPQELAQMLTMLGVETSVAKTTSGGWTNVVSAKITDVKKHPNADKLSLCEVTDGQVLHEIVCGAPNVKPGMFVALAKLGAVLPGGLEIKKAKIRGIESCGMLCSAKELGISEESQGIMELDPQTKIGLALEAVLGQEKDAILEIEITPNRGDCLSHYGVAREIAAKLKKNLIKPNVKVLNTLIGHNIKVESDLCQRYIGVVIKNIEVKPSPKWLANALEKCGLRSINNIVDITNYVMLELGQPLHVFDVDKLAGHCVNARRAKIGETILALDGKEYNLDEEMLVIADSKNPVAIAGVMGGQLSSITEDTKNIFLESAIFNASSIRKTSRKLRLSSDSSYRYERGVDWAMADTASWRAVNLIMSLAGGTIECRNDVADKKRKKTEIVLRFERLKRDLGYEIDENETGQILRHLGCALFPRKEVILCEVPTYRNDISCETDLIEEIARVHGYDKIPEPPRRYEKHQGSKSYFCDIVQSFRHSLAGLGFCEALNYSFLEDSASAKFGLENYFTISNPSSRENEVLRSSLLPALYKNLLTNLDYGADTVALFEDGKVFAKDGERENFSAIMYGKYFGDWWKWENAGVDGKYNFYLLGAIVDHIIPEDFSIGKNLSPHKFFHPTQNAAVIYRGKPVGQFGALSPAVSKDIKGDVFYFEFDVEYFRDLKFKQALYKPFAKFPSVKRDISLIADKDLPFEKIEDIIRRIKKDDKMIESFKVFSVYEDSAKIGADKIGYSIRLVYRNNERTLTDIEVNENMLKLIETLKEKLSVVLRV